MAYLYGRVYASEPQTNTGIIREDTHPAITTRLERCPAYGNGIVDGIVGISPPAADISVESALENFSTHRMLSSSGLVRGGRRRSAPARYRSKARYEAHLAMRVSSIVGWS